MSGVIDSLTLGVNDRMHGRFSNNKVARYKSLEPTPKSWLSISYVIEK